ncbi:hypothetical protein V8F06_010010 [Rhypophila decipiens]
MTSAAQDVFLGAKASFLSSLPEAERHRFTSCISAEVLILELQGLDSTGRKYQVGKKWLRVLENLAERLNPYFDIIGIFVSSNPEYSALVWGSLRLILKVAMDYHSFFDKLTNMLSSLAEALPDYRDLLNLCVQKKISSDDQANPGRMRHHIEQLYVEIFMIFKMIIRLFVKPNGKARRTAAVAGSVIWTPFEGRFGNLLKRMQEHRAFVLTQLTIWHASQTSKEIARAAAERDISVIEREDAAKERELMQKERVANEESRRAIHAQIRALEKERKEYVIWWLQNWVSPPSGFATKYQTSLKQRTQGTARWLFGQKAYTRWLSDKHGDDCESRVPASERRFGTNSLWVQGNPGAGKTVLAAAVVEELLATRESSGVYYHFFDFKCPHSCGSSAALRAILSQLLSAKKEDTHLLDTMTFAAYSHDQGQLTATDRDVVELLRLCLGEDAIIVLDGIDECTDSEHLIETIVSLSHHLPATRTILFSRVNVPALKVSVLTQQIFSMPKSKIGVDIRRFLVTKLDQLLEDEILPPSCAGEKNELADRLCKGADGMFLWAQLMARCLRFSCDMTKDERLDMIRQVRDPEGLEAIYERIVAVIRGSGRRPSVLASRVLEWLTFSVTPLTSRQLRQAIKTQGNSPSTAVSTSDEASEFEDTAIMACAGLIERSKVFPNSESPKGEPGLRFIHLSLQQLIRGESTTGEPAATPLLDLGPLSPPNGLGVGVPYLKGGPNKPPLVFQSLVASPASANLALARVCLHQLLYHTPAQPLGGAFRKRISEDELNKVHCFSSYAAVQWLIHLERCLLRMEDDINNSDHPPPSSLLEFVKLISTFLDQPRVLSAWLEAYYVSRHQAYIAEHTHPPVATLCRWLDFISELVPGNQARMEKLVRSVRELSQVLVTDVERIRKLWGIEAVEAPHLVWDEMAYFAGTELFFDPKSIKISAQEPQPPDTTRWPGISTKSVAKISRASPNTYVKGLLYVWGPQEIHDSDTFTNIRVRRRHLPHDIRALCTGWVATYQIWKIGSDKPGAGIELALDPEEIYHPLRKYLDEPFSGGIDFPLAISHDALSFCVLRCVYAIQPSPTGDASASKLSSQKLHVTSPYEHDFMWTAPDHTAFASSYFYDLHFSPCTRFLALLESNLDGTTCISVFRCLLDPVAGIMVDVLNRIALSVEIQKVQHLIMHDRCGLMAFCGTISLADRGPWREKSVFMWDFTSGSEESLIRRSLANYWSAKSISFSSCGTHLVIQPDFPANAQPVIIPCPQSSLRTLHSGDQDTPLLLGQGEKTMARAEPPSSAKVIMGTSQLNPERELSSLPTPIMPTTQVSHVSPSPTSRTEVILVHGTGAGTVHTTEILSLPAAVATNTLFAHAAMVPETADDTYKISLDLQLRRHYPLHQAAASSNNVRGATDSRPMVIERHPAFVTTTTTTAAAPTTTPTIPRRICGALEEDIDAGRGWTPCPGSFVANSQQRRLGHSGEVEHEREEEEPPTPSENPLPDDDPTMPADPKTTTHNTGASGGGMGTGTIVNAVLGVPSLALGWLRSRLW